MNEGGDGEESHRCISTQLTRTCWNVGELRPSWALCYVARPLWAALRSQLSAHGRQICRTPGWRSTGSKVCFREPDKYFPMLIFQFSFRWFGLDHGPWCLETSKQHYGFRKSSLLCLWFRKCGQKWVPWAHGGALWGPQEVQVQQQHKRRLQNCLQALWKNGSTAEDEVEKVLVLYNFEIFLFYCLKEEINMNGHFLGRTRRRSTRCRSRSTRASSTSSSMTFQKRWHISSWHFLYHNIISIKSTILYGI